ncbi:MAG TPA: succinylglutamate desuccinylase/aspartoacylase family protein, partial [Acidobacteriota bacterium]|nr:succinylglutamate desuccinylase/aspartoacylase family protein [Acidobacteriota bacterium]
MLAHALVTTQAPPQFHRIIGTYGGTAPGPQVICIGGIHGNEPAGVHALKRVIHQLNETRPPFQGEIVALSGNLNALNSECRFFSKDLNRQWTTAKIQAVKDTLRPDELDAE